MVRPHRLFTPAHDGESRGARKRSAALDRGAAASDFVLSGALAAGIAVAGYAMMIEGALR